MRYLSIIIALLLHLSLAAQPIKPIAPKRVGMDQEHLKYADKVIEEAIEKGYTPGAVLAVVKGGYMPYIKAYGNRSLAPTVEPMSEDTIFDIASCTKPVVTAIATMMLVERGQIALWDSVNRYIPNFNDNKRVDNISRTIRINHLLTHTSGLNPYVMVETLESEYDVVTRDSLVDYLVNSEIRYSPGEMFRYSCLNFILLQHIIEQVTGESLRDFAKRNIFDPLKMESTDYIPLDSLGQPIEMDRSRRFDMSKIAPTEMINDSTAMCGYVNDPLAREVNGGVSGNSGVFSTASDLATLMAVLLNDGVYGSGERLLKPLTMETMRTVPDPFFEKGRALGWDVSSPYASNRGDLLSTNILGHTGFTGTSLMLDSDNDVAIILLTNAIHSPNYSVTEIIHLRATIANIVAASIIAD